MKDIIYLGSSLKELQAYDHKSKERIAFQLERLRQGLMPTDWKPMKSIGEGVQEIRIHSPKEIRIIYVAKWSQAIYVLHVFAKKSQKTRERDITIAKQRYQDLKGEKI